MKINGENYLWLAVDHESEVLESYVTKRRDRKAALKFIRKSMKRYGAAMKLLATRHRRKRNAGLTTERKNHVFHFDEGNV